MREKKSIQAIGITATVRGLSKQNALKNFGEIHKEWTAVGGASRMTTPLHARHEFQQSHSLCQATLEHETASEASRLD